MVAPKRFSKNEELFRHLDGEFGSTELFFKYGVLPEHPTPFDRIYLNDESFISFLFSNVAVERKDVLMLLVTIFVWKKKEESTFFFKGEKERENRRSKFKGDLQKRKDAY